MAFLASGPTVRFFACKASVAKSKNCKAKVSTICQDFKNVMYLLKKVYPYYPLNRRR